MAAKKSNFYLTREELVREIVLSKQKHREHPDRTPAQCFTLNLTNYLVMMVDRYSKKGQWRNYCVDETTEALTHRGWLGINQITEDDIILSYHEGQLKWSSIKGIYRSEYSGNMFHLTIQGLDALVTPGHKFLTTDDLTPVEFLKEKDQLILLGDAVSGPTNAVYEDAFVELASWVVTEGNYYLDPSRSYCRISISQNEGVKANRIRSCLDTLGVRYGEHHSENDSGKTLVCFHLTKEICDRIVEVLPNKNPTMNFILSLTPMQRELAIDTMVAADGWVNYGKYRNYGQCDKEHVDVFLALCTMAGYQTSVKLHDPVGYGKKPFYKVRIFSNPGHKSVVENVDFHGGKNNKRVIGEPKETYPNQPTIPYNGQVWCPQTEYGSFVARRNGTIFLTGNSYIEDMKSDALLTLCQNAFKYNEEKYDNPFGYYTQIIKYCFITFLEKEEIIRDIKDSLWESIGMTPSYARQIKNEMLKDVPDQSAKGMKVLKKDAEALNLRVEAIASIISRLNRGDDNFTEIDMNMEIAEVLELEILPYTSNLASAILLFETQPKYIVENGVEVAGEMVNCLTLYDESTKSNTKRVIADTEDNTVVRALCSIGLAIRRDLLVKRLREISGYNITSTRIPTAERLLPLQNEVEFGDEPRLTMNDYILPGGTKKKGRKKNAV